MESMQDINVKVGTGIKSQGQEARVLTFVTETCIEVQKCGVFFMRIHENTVINYD